MRLFFFVVLIFSAYLLPIWLFLLLCFAYAVLFQAYELLILGLLVDAQFGIGVFPYSALYTLSIGTIIFVAEIIKPYLLFYREEYVNF